MVRSKAWCDRHPGMIQQRKSPLASLAPLLINQGAIPQHCQPSPNQPTKFHHAIQEIFIQPSRWAVNPLGTLQVIEINKQPPPTSSIIAIKKLITSGGGEG